jgi:hypothetical protein
LIAVFGLVKKINAKILFVVFIGSFFVNVGTTVDLIKSNQEVFSEGLNNKVNTYTNEDKVEALSDGGSGLPWYAALRTPILFYALMFFFLFSFYKSELFRSQAFTKWLLVFWSIVNVISGIPSLGGRYKFILMGLLLLSTFLWFTDKKRDHKIPIWNIRWLHLANFLWIIVSLRIGSLFLSSNVFFGNIFLAFYKEDVYTLYDVTNMLFK